MKRRSRLLQSSWKHWRLGLLALLAGSILAGCAAPPVIPPPVEAAPPRTGALLGRDQDYAVVIAQPGDTFATLAARYIGSADKDWWISEFNGVDQVHAGQEIVIPLRAHNLTGVYANGFQTVTILCYHRFGPNRSAMTLAPATFEAQMDYLKSNGYRVITMKELAAYLAGKEPLPKKTVVITIDDGYRATYQVAYPVLKKYGFPATVYLYSDFVGAADALTWPQMQEMVKSGLIEIQPHSKSHPNLTLKLPGESDAKYLERMRREVDAPIATIQNNLGLKSFSFAYPYGDVTETIVDLLTRDGVQLGVTVTSGGNGFFSYPYMLRRTMIFGNDDMETFKSKLVTFVRTASR
jgi:peptidoglycan/xylan/chitin deacetylase (PgdA/CDA1 family)